MDFENTYLTLHYTNQDVHIFCIFSYIICSYIYIVYSNFLISFYNFICNVYLKYNYTHTQFSMDNFLFCEINSSFLFEKKYLDSKLLVKFILYNSL